MPKPEYSAVYLAPWILIVTSILYWDLQLKQAKEDSKESKHQFEKLLEQQTRLVEHVPEAIRERFQDEYAKFKSLRFEIENIESQFANPAPALAIASDRVNSIISERDSINSDRVRIRSEYLDKGENVYKTYIAWVAMVESQASCDVVEEMSKDPVFCEFYGRLAGITLAAMIARDNKPDDWNLVEDLIPRDIATLAIAPAARAIVLEWSRRKASHAAPKLKELEAVLNPSREARETAYNWSKTSSQLSFYKSYVNAHSSAEVDRLRAD